jgi:hypothetical protein
MSADEDRLERVKEIESDLLEYMESSEYAANVASIKAECDAGEHRGPEGPNEDLAQCPLCWSMTFSRRPDGETFGNHADDCSLPSEHLSFCVGGGSGHPPAPKARGWG